MNKPHATRTYAPIRLADLDPHRFEDLVRNLAYDFRDWLTIEALGRAGDEQGFDVRAWEKYSDPDDDQDLDSSTDFLVDPPFGRQWMFQCKREHQIGPKKLEKYLRGLQSEKSDFPHGLVFVGACNFSKKSHDLFRELTRELGFQEAYLWGVGEIEDLLFQPKNDHLLFAFFGISLQAKKRSTKSTLRSKLVPKRKLFRLSKKEPMPHLLLRDPADERYPDWRESEIGRDQTRWIVLETKGLLHDGIHFKWSCHPAFIGADEKSWDYVEGYNSAIPHRMSNPWQSRDLLSLRRGSWLEHHVALSEWNELQDVERAWFNVEVVLPYEAILEIDEDGDEVFPHPHLYLDFSFDRCFPFRDYYYEYVSGIMGRYEHNRTCLPDENHRVKKFTQIMRTP